MSERERYLWDRSGSTDRDVEALERALAPLRFSGGAAPDVPPRIGGEVVAGGPWRRRVAVAVAVAAAVVVGVWLWPRGPEGRGEELRLAVTADGSVLREGQSFTATRDGERLELAGYAELTLAAGSRLGVERLAPEQALLFLHRGEMEAFVSVDAVERFFQVGTPAARCVDLGCLYNLTVDDDGTAHVIVTLGRVAFENNGREVFVPAQAECWAHPTRGAGTPRFTTCPPAMIAALDAFDRADGESAEARRSRLRSVVAAAGEASTRDHALSLWHISGDLDHQIAAGAVAALGDRHGRPDGLEAGPGEAPTAADRGRWKTHLGVDPFE